MRKIIALIFILLVLPAWGQNLSTDQKQYFAPENLMVDVRTPSEYAYGHIEKAVNIPLDKLTEDIKYFAPDKEKTIVVYCLSGSRANIAVRRLKGLGYKNIINAGRYKDLKALEEEMK